MQPVFILLFLQSRNKCPVTRIAGTKTDLFSQDERRVLETYDVSTDDWGAGHY